MVASTAGPIVITRNLVDLTPDGAPAGGNTTLQVTTADGPVTHGVDVINNLLVGGSYTVQVGPAAKAVRVRGNWILSGPLVGPRCYGHLYPSQRPPDLVWEGNAELGTGLPLAA